MACIRQAALGLALAASACGNQVPYGTGGSPPPAPPRPTQGAPVPPPGYRLVWSDEFDGTALDPSRWTADDGPRRQAIDTPDAVEVRNGVLTITTWTEGGVHHTGFIATSGKFEATYGYYEARIRFSDSPGSWCAFWLQSPTIGRPLGDPATAGVEIDVVEHRAVDQAGADVRETDAVNLNWDGYDEHKKTVQSLVQAPDGVPSLQGNWHTYGVLWTDASYTFYLDAIPVFTTTEAVSRRSEDVRLTCEVQDAAWAGDVPPGGYGPRDASATRMEVDWVRAWQP